VDFAFDLASQEWFREFRSQRPVAAALLESILEPVASLLSRAESRSLTLLELNEELSFIVERAELSSWLIGVKRPPMEESIHQFVDSWTRYLQSLGFSGRQLIEHSATGERVARQKRRGRRPDRKLLAVEAYELKASRPDLTWDDVAENLCDCKKGRHDESCREAIRQDVLRLQKALKKHCVEVPPLN